MLTEREIATLILFAGFLVLVLSRRDTRKAAGALLKAFFVVKIIFPLILYLIYAVALVVLAWWIGIWRIEMLKDTVVVVLTVAIPLMFGVTNADSGGMLVRKVIRETLGVAAIVALYLNLASLSVVAELLIQIFVIVITAIGVFAKHRDAKYRPVARGMDVILVIVGIGMLTFTTVWIVQNWASMNLALIGLTAAMSVWLPILLLPFLYILAFYAAVELILMRLPFFNKKQKPPLRVRIAVIGGLRGSVLYAKRFVGDWLIEAGPLQRFNDAVALMKRFRSAASKQARPS
jgi:hypothetical protein